MPNSAPFGVIDRLAGPHPQWLAIAVAKVREVVNGGAEHRKAAMRVAQRERDTPGYGWMTGQFLRRGPAHVLGCLTDPENGIEHQLDGTRARTDDQIGTRHRL